MITNKQAKILKALQNNEKVVVENFYEMDPSIQSLYDQKFIKFQLGYNGDGYFVEDVFIEPSGVVALDKFNDHRKDNRWQNFFYPVLANIVYALAGFVAGIVLTYLHFK
ncbi:hypothetical protein ABHC39_05295 [Pediococcus acidilactici]|uniref:hypothetical protein n=1 Tax=Pediococcus acidilactici TaxID=1254 RepID=UPI00232BA07A|nr:hypothetical protein [Pediococcus acidilactici]MDB8867652.1 hypothetical protein [Pediococcus acidilactici]